MLSPASEKVFKIKHPWNYSPLYVWDLKDAPDMGGEKWEVVQEMTFLEYATKDLPPEFAAFVHHTAWERGHSAGTYEINMLAEEIAADLLPHVREFIRRTGENKS